VSFVPYRDTRRARRKPLDRGQIVRAALELLDEVGLDELTMRRLAERLGIKAASLYRHVRDKDELLVLLADEISGAIPEVTLAGAWQQQLSQLAWNARRGLLSHRDAARLLASTAPFGPRRLRHIETALGILRAAGLSDRDAARAAYHFNNFVTEFAADEGRYAAAAAALGVSRRKMLAEARRQFKSLPADEYPLIVALAEPLSEDDPDGLFQFGLDLWLRGLGGAPGPGPLATSCCGDAAATAGARGTHEGAAAGGGVRGRGRSPRTAGPGASSGGSSTRGPLPDRPSRSSPSSPSVSAPRRRRSR
jgi:TetR/AcrR family tetracycline transcriptional repressor